MRAEALFGAAAQAFHIARERSKRSRACTGSLAAPERSESTAACSQIVAIELWLLAGTQARRRNDPDGCDPCSAERGGTATSSTRSARTLRKALRAPHG